jgi:hypothetical protein
MMATPGIDSIAAAEKILNRTLAYQAATAVHELKDRLDLDIAEIRLVVAPLSSDALGCYLPRDLHYRQPCASRASVRGGHCAT